MLRELHHNPERPNRMGADTLLATAHPRWSHGICWGQLNGHNWAYIPVPFLFTPRGLGIYLDTAAVTTFDVGTSVFSVRLPNPSVDIRRWFGTTR